MRSAPTYDLLREVKAWPDEAVSPAGYNLGWNWASCRAGGDACTPSCDTAFTEEPLAGKAGIRTLLKSKANQW